MEKILIKNVNIVNEGRIFNGSIVIEADSIVDISEQSYQPEASFDKVIDASGCFVLPGIIDDHVHFREPGLTQKADIESESRAAAVGGVTSYFDMPNTVPQTTTLQSLKDKFERAKTESHVNYSFFFGATNDNSSLFQQLDVHSIPGIKLFMGSSTGNMLVDRREALETIFRTAPLPIMAHCEDTNIINQNMIFAKNHYGEDPDVKYHPMIRSVDACYQSTKTAVELARKYGTRLHVAHLTTARELELFSSQYPNITAEAVVGHLYFSDEDYSSLGSRIKVNPAIKSKTDRDALRQALNDGRIAVVGTDHAPHLIAQKEGGCCKAASGMPMIQFSLVTMLELVDDGVLTLPRMVELMCHRPAKLFEISKRGYIRKGYKADLVLVRPHSPWTVTPDIIESKCGWSPVEGHTYNWKVERTFCNGHEVYNCEKGVDTVYRGEQIEFRR